MEREVQLNLFFWGIQIIRPNNQSFLVQIGETKDERVQGSED